MDKEIVIIGARTNNLKNLNCSIPTGKLTVITGVSGSGKSSLAFDTLYAEGQRRYVESMSTYARLFLERMERPDVDSINHIQPAIALEQKNTVKNARSTVGTATELNDYLRLLYAKVGRTFCPECNVEVKKDNPESATKYLSEAEHGTKIMIISPLKTQEERLFKTIKDEMIKQGFYRIYEEGRIINLEEEEHSFSGKKKKIDILIDRIQVNEDSIQRLNEALETAFKIGLGKASAILNGNERINFDSSFNCTLCSRIFKEPEPLLFSFNSPLGACPVCHGFGRVAGIDIDRVIPDKTLSIKEGAIAAWNTPSYQEMYHDLENAAKKHRISLDKPFKDLTEKEKEIIINGTGDYIGIKGFFEWFKSKKYKVHVRVMLARYRSYTLCETCRGKRLRSEALNVKFVGKDISELSRMSINDLGIFFNYLTISNYEYETGKNIIKEIKSRFKYLNDVGLGYLTLDRQTRTLSGGEMQRISLASAIGSSLTDTLYVLDEPTVGLHARDSTRLLNILKSLKESGNTVVVVEHDRTIIKGADKIIDLGPGAGHLGGELIFEGTLGELLNSKESLTARFLKNGDIADFKSLKRNPKGFLQIRNACKNNLKNLNVNIPLGVLTCITGVSGSGKSTLVDDVLYAGFKTLSEKVKTSPLPSHFQGENGKGFDSIEGIELLEDIILMDQSPIGRSVRSNPVTYIKAYDDIRKIVASTRDAKTKGLTARDFSFNVEGGRCDVCKGTGIVVLEMYFMADIEVKCDKCNGKRFTRAVLDVRYKGKNIDEIFDLTVEEAIKFFIDKPEIIKKLRILRDIGLGYMKLGQGTSTLSGGEAQRLKLAGFLAQSRGAKKYLFVFDEPTTGLHLSDVEILIKLFQRLVDFGHSILVIEHNIDFIKAADYIIDLGPEGGQDGGYIVAQGTIDDIIACKYSYTGRYLKENMLK